MSDQPASLENALNSTAAFTRFLLIILTTIGVSGFSFLHIIKETREYPELQALALSFSLLFFLLIILSAFFVIAMFLVKIIEHAETAQQAQEPKFKLNSITGYAVAKVTVLGLLVIVLLQYRTNLAGPWHDLENSFADLLRTVPSP